MKKNKKVTSLKNKYMTETPEFTLISNRMKQLEAEFGFEEIEGEFYAMDSYSAIHRHMQNLIKTYGRVAVDQVILSLYGDRLEEIA